MTVFARPAPRIVAIIPSHIASCQINVIKPLTALERAGHIKFRHVLESKASLPLIKWADALVLCRNTEPAYGHLLSEAIGRKKPVIYDIDDSFWNITEATDPELARYHLQPLRLRQLEQYLCHASLVRVYSPLLESKIRQFNDNVRLCRSGFDFSLVPHLSNRPPHKAGPSCKGRTEEKISIVYATSRTVDDQYKIFLPALIELLEQEANRLSFTVWGCSPPELLNLPGVRWRRLTAGYDDFLREFSRSGFHIGLAPLVDNEFNRSKNNTKFRDYGACQVAGVYSDLDVYASSIRDKENGLLVPNRPDAWYQAIKLLSSDSHLRGRIVRKAYEDVFENYRQELIEQQWLSDIESLLEDAQSFWFSRLSSSDFTNIKIKADKDNLCGIEIEAPDFAFDQSKNDKKVCMELQTAKGCRLRSIAASVQTKNASDGTIVFTFAPLKNSRDQTLIMRLSGIDKEKPARVSLLYEDSRLIENNGQ